MRSSRPPIASLAIVLAVLGLAPAGAGALPPTGSGAIAFSREHNGTRQIYAVDPALGEVQPVTSDAMQDFDPAWSPDGSELAFAGKSGRFSIVTHLYLLDAAGVRHQQT